ncbi:GNAT family N-acetyltransferase [Pedobacter jamesrossensis]|uniref:GNAT family N-acetyltransferase n=1 Tax=Pedobacter jamesrossensis TaxID=1908238 RepID=A0ABV8NQI4_9SPHI
MKASAKIVDIILKSERLTLRSFCEDDLQNIYKGLSNKDVIKYYGVSYSSLESSKQQLQWFADLQNQGEGIWWAICAPNGVFYGAIGFNNLSVEHKKIELGFWLLPEFWGKGIIAEAIYLTSAYAFNILNINRIEAFVELENKNSAKALLNSSFNYEGTMMDCEIKNGEFISLMIFARFNTTD